MLPDVSSMKTGVDAVITRSFDKRNYKLIDRAAFVQHLEKRMMDFLVFSGPTTAHSQTTFAIRQTMKLTTLT